MKANTTNDFSIEISTVNGSGSQSANTILAKAIFRMGVPVATKNFFPSNIQGQPTWFRLRVNKNKFLAQHHETQIKVAMNPATLSHDIASVTAGGFFIYNQTLKMDQQNLRNDVQNIAVPFKQIVDQITDGIKIKTLLANMAYVGVVSYLINLEHPIVENTIRDHFKKNSSILEKNLNAFNAGWNYASDNLKALDCPFKLEKMTPNSPQIFIDGNSAAAIGALYGGCSFVAWYPITPSTSLVESFQKYASQFRKDHEGKNTYAIVQAEDELAAITMVTGAGWAGARSMTATSGPGLSLMSECAGLCYYSEIPAVIWDVQRAGPSTGLPTRTQQSDLLTAAFLSHGDTKHIILIPNSPKECFELAQVAFDLAEQFQTLVIVLSDLDLGMNFTTDDEFQFPSQPFARGKVLTAQALSSKQSYGRYEDIDGDGIPYRTLPGTEHELASHSIRGSGHDEYAHYSEDPEVYERNLERLNRKWETIKQSVPSSEIIDEPQSKIAIIGYGSSHTAVRESRSLLKDMGIPTGYLRPKSFPFHQDLKNFCEKYEKIFVVDQNRDSQLLKLLILENPDLQSKLHPIRHFDGSPITAKSIIDPIVSQLRGNHG